MLFLMRTSPIRRGANRSGSVSAGFVLAFLCLMLGPVQEWIREVIC